MDAEPRISRAEEKRQQERRSLPWRLGLANLLSAGLHLIPMGLVGWQPRIPEEVDLITFQWVEVEAEPPPDPHFIAPISARESGRSERWDPYVSVRQTQVANPRDGFDGAEVPPAAASPFQTRSQPLLPPPVDSPEVPRPTRNPATSPRQPLAARQAKLEDLENAVAEQDWAEALQLTEDWLDHLPPTAQQRQQLQDYRQHLQSLLSAPTEPELAEPHDPQPEAPVSSPELLPQPHLLAQADPRPILPPPEPAPQEAPLPPLLPMQTPLFGANSQPVAPLQQRSPEIAVPKNNSQGSPNSNADHVGPPSLNAAADLDWGEYLAQFQERVRQHWAVQRAAGSYVTVVQLRLDRKGSLRELRLHTPSEDPLLDAAVLSAIQRSAPFAPLPSSYTGEELVLEIDVLSGSLEAGPPGVPEIKSEPLPQAGSDG
ncbi:MAG: TonB C-terminal domain-containing protein [Thermostichus sp. HHBFW_bins_43]